MAGKRLALIVATDEYLDPGLGKLRAPAKDAEALAGVLADPELGDFEVEVLRNATSSAIAERVETLLTGGSPNDLIVLHFSCHGIKDDSGELYLAATNTRPDLLASTAVDASLVNRLIRRSRAQRAVLFLDCCFGGAFERGVVPRAAGVIDVADQFRQRDEELAGGRGRVVITASNAMEFAFEGADLADSVAARPSIFTGALVEGLTTGEADRDQDGMVSLGELYDYVFEKVRQATPNQSPGKWEFGLQGELFLAKNPQRVIVPAPLPADLLALVEHPFPPTRLGAVDVLVRLAEGTNLPIAAAARGVIERLVHDDSKAVALAAAEAIARTGLRLSAVTLDLGTVGVGAAAAGEVSIEGPPLATASRVESTSPRLRARRLDRTIRIDADTADEGRIDGTVAVVGPAGTAEIHVVGVVGPIAADDRAAETPPAPETVPAEEHEPAEETVSPHPAMATEVTSLSEDGRALEQAAPKEEQPGTDPVESWNASYPAARAVIGAVIGDLVSAVGFFITTPGLSGSSTILSVYIGFTFKVLVVDAIAFTVAVLIAERLLPSIRIPGGRAYGPWSQHRIRAAAIQGAVVGVTVALIDYYAMVTFTPGAQFDPSVLYWAPAGAAFGFALAEALLLGIRSGSRR